MLYSDFLQSKILHFKLLNHAPLPLAARLTRRKLATERDGVVDTGILGIPRSFLASPSVSGIPKTPFSMVAGTTHSTQHKRS